MPFVEDWDKTELRFRRDSIWWRRTEDLIGAVRERCDGKLLINPPTLVANLDCLAAVRGTEKLLMDLVECPEKIKRALDQVCRAHDEVLSAYAELLDFDRYGSINVEMLYSTGRISRPQCDVSCMIAGDMFKEFVVPCLKREAAAADGMHYHLDGHNALRHLETLCAMEELDSICYVPTGKEGDLKAIHRRIDALGKGQSFWPVGPDEIRDIWRDFTSRKLVFSCSVGSKAEAEDFLAELDEMGTT